MNIAQAQGVHAALLVCAATRLDAARFWRSTPLGRSLARLRRNLAIRHHIWFSNRQGLPALYNQSLALPDAPELIAWVHDDVWIDDLHLLHHLREGLARYDVLGVVGNRRRAPRQPSWAFVNERFEWDAREHLSGTLGHASPQGGLGLAAFSGPAPADCELLDGVFLAARRSRLREAGVAFDPRFDFHLYDVDFCRSARAQGLRLGTWPISLTHHSTGRCGDIAWQQAWHRYLAKWGEADITPPPNMPARPPSAAPAPATTLAQARALLQAGQPAAAAALCQPLLAQHPADAALHATAGLAAAQQGQWPAALSSLQRAAELAPAQAGHWLNLGNVQQQLRQWAAAQASFERAAALTPAAPEPHFNLGNLHRAAGQPGRAVAAYRAALQRRPDWWAAREHLAGQLAAQGLHDQAVAEADALLQARPDHAPTWALRGAWQQALRRPDAALDSLTQALRLRPQDDALAATVCQLRQQLCDWQDWPDDHTPPAPAALSPLAALALPLGAARTLAAAQRASAALQPTPAPATVWPQPRAAAPLRIAYVSGDLRNHAIGQLVAGVLAAHDRTRFEVHAIAWQQREPDAMARRIAQSVAPHWHPVDGLDDAAVLRLARGLQLDVAVDLAGHTAGHRLGLFARRLAPVQLSWLGLPNSTGAAFIDYLVADAVVLPPALRHGASEALIRLGCFQPNDRSRPAPAAVATPAREPGVSVVYACFNQALKITPAVFSAWMQILQRVPGAQLWLLAEHPAQVGNLQREARARGVDPARQLRCWPRASYAEHLARHRAVDVVLDTQPFNGGTTTADALSRDCPVLTCPGDTMASRMAASLLTRSGLPEGICADLPAYVQQAIAWADPVVRQPLRARLQAARSAPGGLFDAATCTRELEAALQQAVARHRAGLPPADMDVSPPEGLHP